MRQRLGEIRPLASDAISYVRRFYDIEFVYESNAIEGNTLTLRETSEVIEHGIAIGSKRLKDYIEAIDHYDAVLLMRSQAERREIAIREGDICALHQCVVARSEPHVGGRYSEFQRRIAGSGVVFPDPSEIPDLMSQFGQDLSRIAADEENLPERAFDAHLRLVSIHPFSDGNGRTARLLMNLILLRAGYPMLSIKPEDRGAYLDVIEHAQLNNDDKPFQEFMHFKLERGMSSYLSAIIENTPALRDISPGDNVPAGETNKTTSPRSSDQGMSPLRP
ncbi:cell filamentation cAMP-inducing protein Fic [Gluconacetobacter sacchari DSM 12717]|uniref:Fic family protein n=3 Tax=Gluconacetobacter sacchari TaxID=92759 RepID=A0A7W4IA09_9PROT|nr:Fic family protein [Gluconacetobacter sacchari]GBQ31362.1 cell filamentation cAMP-inducing protein Fic [Gluconacetobacter sacchari DSM 12717]